MTLLAIALPLATADEYAWATSADGTAVTATGVATAALLPARGRGADVVAVVPAAALSWQRVTLPRGIGPRSARLRPVLTGLLEERLLDEPQDLHFALAPAPAADGATWVAICRRDWLQGHLQTLEAAGCAVGRIVPELAPDLAPARLWFTGAAEHPQLLAAGAGIAGGVLQVPATRATLALAREPGAADGAQPLAPPLIYAEPAAAAAAESLLDAPHVTLAAPAARWLDACSSDWDLAQLEFARRSSARAARRLRAAGQALLHAPRWRALRWGLAALVAAQLVGINVAAWHARQAVAAERAAVRGTLLQSFPETQAVVDAPLQMMRALSALETRTGALRPDDLEPLLAAFASAAPAGSVPTSWTYGDGSLRLSGLNLPAAALASARDTLAAQGYALSKQQGALILRAAERP